MSLHERLQEARASKAAVRQMQHEGDYFVVRRPFSMGGRRYASGSKIKSTKFTPDKAAQLVELRYLVSNRAQSPVVVARPFAGLKVGDKFPLEGVRPAKVKQLLEHRFIKPQAITA